MIARRRRRLAVTTNRLLDVAAAVEGPFPFEPVRAAAGLSDAEGLAALDEALHAQLVVPDTAADRYDFTHALIRHTVHRELNPSRRLRLHRDLAVALGDRPQRRGLPHRRRGGGDPVPPGGGPLPDAVAGIGFALEAADRAGAAGAHAEQVTSVGIACDLLPDGDDRRPGSLSACAPRPSPGRCGSTRPSTRRGTRTEPVIGAGDAGGHRHRVGDGRQHDLDAWQLAADGMSAPAGWPTRSAGPR